MTGSGKVESLSLCSQVGFTVFLNLVGSVSAIAAIVLYSLDVKNASLLWMCGASSSVALPHNDGCRNVALLVQVQREACVDGPPWWSINTMLPGRPGPFIWI